MADSSPKLPLPASPSHADRDDELVQRRSFRDYYIILRERIWIALPLALLPATHLLRPHPAPVAA